jgi:hypothetical protein
MSKKLNTLSFIEKANIKHNNYYNYSLVNYNNAVSKVIIICPKHGEFLQQPNNHLFGQGCIKCMGDRVRNSRKSNKEEFIKKSILIHGNKYDYSLVNYKTGKDKVIIICPKHGEFLQTPFAHCCISMQQGCPFCKISKGEDEIEKFLIKNNINYLRQYKFKNLKNPKTNKSLPFDFYLYDINTIIEYNGEQHFKKIKYFEKRSGGFEELKFRDNIKKEFLKNNNINLIEINYNQFNKIENILNNII